MTKPFEIDANITKHKEKLGELLSSDTYSFSIKPIRTTKDAGVYIIYDRTLGQVLYVGESDNLRRRSFTNHRSGNRRGSAFRRALSIWQNTDNEREIKEYIVQNCLFQILQIPDKLKRKKFEHFAISALDPILNDFVK